jgi:hypothetical protein
MEEKSPSTIISYDDVVVNPREDLIVIVEPTEGVRGGRMRFDAPAVEPIDSYVAQTVMIKCDGATVVASDCRGEGFDITAWNPDTQELRVQIRDKHFYGIE